MYERFTDRARKTMQFANADACSRGHEYVATEHVLYGLLKEDHGVYATVLSGMGIKKTDILNRLDQLVSPDTSDLLMGKLPLTPRTKNVIEYSIGEARDFGHGYVGTEHLLLGLVRVAEGNASIALQDNGFRLESGREAVISLLGCNTE